MVDNYPILTLLPPILAIGLVVATRKVLLSLGLGVVAAALLIEGFSPWGTLKQVLGSFAEIFWTDGALNTTKVYILIFTLMLGVITAFIMMSGGTRAFADWAQTKIKTRRGATMLPAGLGMAIFVDDYFNALAVGQVSRPVTDTHRVSRAKLAYMVDSTSAPVAVLVPFSSWGAFILGLIGIEVAASSLDKSDISAFIEAALSNYYAFAALLLVAIVATMQLDIGPMRGEERRAILEGEKAAMAAMPQIRARLAQLQQQRLAEAQRKQRQQAAQETARARAECEARQGSVGKLLRRDACAQAGS